MGFDSVLVSIVNRPVGEFLGFSAAVHATTKRQPMAVASSLAVLSCYPGSSEHDPDPRMEILVLDDEPTATALLTYYVRTFRS